jgi:hypothetical protein
MLDFFLKHLYENPQSKKKEKNAWIFQTWFDPLHQ